VTSRERAAVIYGCERPVVRARLLSRRVVDQVLARGQEGGPSLRDGATCSSRFAVSWREKSRQRRSSSAPQPGQRSIDVKRAALYTVNPQRRQVTYGISRSPVVPHSSAGYWLPRRAASRRTRRATRRRWPRLWRATQGPPDSLLPRPPARPNQASVPRQLGAARVSSPFAGACESRDRDSLRSAARHSAGTMRPTPNADIEAGSRCNTTARNAGIRAVTRVSPRRRVVMIHLTGVHVGRRRGACAPCPRIPIVQDGPRYTRSSAQKREMLKTDT
jgi:hypothetical protein